MTLMSADHVVGLCLYLRLGFPGRQFPSIRRFRHGWQYPRQMYLGSWIPTLCRSGTSSQNTSGVKLITQMYRGLGAVKATSVLAGAAAAMAPIPWIFYRYGPTIRKKSAYHQAAMGRT